MSMHEISPDTDARACAHADATTAQADVASWPLLVGHDPGRVVAWRDGRAVTAATFLGHVATVARCLPGSQHVINLCEDRYVFLVAFCAALTRGQINLLPPSRAPQAVAEVMATHPGCRTVGDTLLPVSPPGHVHLPRLDANAGDSVKRPVPHIDAAHVAAIGYTSGSTGRPQASVKTWGSYVASTAGNLAMLRAHLDAPFHVLATVPPQHMYGMEMSVLLPLLAEVGVHAGRPLLPADVARALQQLPAPRVLVTTPVHLRALVASGQQLAPLAAMVSATAPMPTELARAAEARFNAPLLEVFGSTETCVFAGRRSALEQTWAPYPGVSLEPQPDGTRIRAPQLAAPVMLADIMELDADGRFRLVGRQGDLLEMAGKRASLADLNQRLLAIDGVEDGVMFQLDSADRLGVRRLAALVVAPNLDAATITARLRCSVDAVFLPRPLRKVSALPRNATGKLPRAALLALLDRHEGG